MTAPPVSDLRRVLLYAHDTYGLGHLRRNLAIAGRLLAGRPGLQVVLMTGSPVAGRFPLPPGLTLVQLPPVVKVDADTYRPRDPRWSFPLVRRARSAIMSDTVRRFRPDVFLVDHAPHGMKGELRPVFSTIRAYTPATRVVLGLRDVLDSPATVRRTWAAEGVYRTLETVFDRIVVYGSAELFDVVPNYGLSAVAAKLTHIGYLGAAASAPPPAASDQEPLVVGTAGGGGDGAEVLAATLAASVRLGLPSLVVTGPLMNQPDRAALAAAAARQPTARIAEFVPDLGCVISRARAVVTMGGYNSLCELAARGVPTVVVPRVRPRREQAIRAELFAGLGIARMVLPGPELEHRLADALGAAIAAGPRSGTGGLDLGGLDRLDRVLANEARTSRLAARSRDARAMRISA